MTEEGLIALFERRGLCCVQTVGYYYALRKEDIHDKRVKPGIYPVLIVSDYALEEVRAADIERCFARLPPEATATGTPFDTQQPYLILPREKPPEWRGHDIKYLRRIFGWDAKNPH